MKKFLLLLVAALMVTGNAEAKFLFFGKKKAKKAKVEAAAKAAKEAAEKKKKDEQPDLTRPGMLTVEKKKTDWFLLLPDSLLGKDMLLTTRFTSTPAGSGKFGGEEVNEQTVYFEMTPDSNLVMRVRLFVNVSDSTQNINRAITISNENPIIMQVKPESHKGQMIKFKANQFLMEDNSTTSIPQQEKKQFQIGGMMPNLSYIEDIKSFPMNTEFRLVKTYACQSESLPTARETGKVTIGLNVSMVLLPEVPMQPRLFDYRVGYFNNGYNTYNDNQQRVDQQINIARYRLEPRPEDIEKMKQGELVEPIKPIVYYIDPATPKQWRKYLIQGVNDWQKAFEQAGFKNAIRGEEWPENDSTMSMEDARFCVIRYLASPIANAYGPHVSDPRTGEILESHICWYHNVMSLVHDWYMVQASSIDEAARKMHYDEELMGQLIRFVSSHEVGHSLGLRHNFGSSSTVPVDSLRNKAWVEAHGHTPSIMDYARFNYVAQPEDGISHEGIFPRINDYDMWAIEWGYRPMFAETSLEDHMKLDSLMKARNVAANPRLWWGDGETRQDDPRRQTEDLGDDAVKASEYGILNLKREVMQLQDWTREDRDIYQENLSTMYNQIRNQFLRYSNHVIRNIGGTLENYRTADDNQPVYVPQPKAKQKAALDFVNRHLLQEPKWLREVPYAGRLTSDPKTLTQALGTNAISGLIARARNLNKEYKAEEYFADLTRLICNDLGTSDEYRQLLHTTYVSGLLNLYAGSSSSADELRGIALKTLKQLQSRMSGNQKPYVMSLKDKIDRALVIK